MTFHVFIVIICLSLYSPFIIAAQDLYFSEYIEGTQNNKALELTNTTGKTVDLSPYKIAIYFNGSRKVGLTVNLVGSLPNNAVFVIAHKHANADILAVTDQYIHKNGFNGNDAIVLLHNTKVIDVIGQVGFDPGKSWGKGKHATKNNTLRRIKANSLGPINPYKRFEPSENWQGFGLNKTDGVGLFEPQPYLSKNRSNTSSIKTHITQPTTPPLPSANKCGSPATPISAIQGSTNQSPFVNKKVIVEAVVVGDFQNKNQLKGFFIQEEEKDQDTSPQTSEGLFIFSPSQRSINVNVGDLVRVSGTVSEYFNLTQLSQIKSIIICKKGLNIKPTPLHFPLNNINELEQLENMLVKLPQTMMVSSNKNLARYHEVMLASERLYQPTQQVYPGKKAIKIKNENALKTIRLDDASFIKNPKKIHYPSPQLQENNTLRAGDAVSNLTGVLSYNFNSYRIHPTVKTRFIHLNKRSQLVNTPKGDQLHVASFNIHNYFNGNGKGKGFPTSRGADTQSEFKRQQQKIINALLNINADILGLIEIENDGYGKNSAIAHITNQLNHYGHHYKYIKPRRDDMGHSEIAVGVIYKADRVTPINAASILNNKVDPTFNDTKNRPSMAQTFKDINTKGVFTLVVNHFKSKGSNCAHIGDPDLNDGQGHCNKTRLKAARALVKWLATDPTNSKDNDYLIIGDLNAYAKEDPITMLINAGYIDLLDARYKGKAYSYIYSGLLGYLDYALANNSMQRQIKGIHVWHINADEPPAFDYNKEHKTKQQLKLWYAPNAYRSSDHDPIIIQVLLENKNN